MAETDPTVDQEDPSTITGETSKLEFDLFWRETSDQARRRYWIHFAIYVILLAAVVWPIFSIVNQIEPYILGLPFNIFWVFLVLVIIPINTYLLYRFDEGKVLGGGE